MANTTNFGWETPDDTDLVKDGAAAIRTLGSAIDTSLVDLKGGTTGQVLAKASNTDMDFTWTAGGDITEVVAGTGLSGGGTSGSVTLTNTVATAFDAAGDLVYGTGADTFTKLGIGTAGQVLKVNSGATAPEWGAAPSPSDSWTLLNSGGTTLSGSSTITVSFTAQNKLWIYLQDSSVGTSAAAQLRLNSDSGTNYRLASWNISGTDTIGLNNSNTTQWQLGGYAADGSTLDGYINLEGCNGSGIKTMSAVLVPSDGDSGTGRIIKGQYAGTSAITSISIISNSGNFDAGKVFVYGA